MTTTDSTPSTPAEDARHLTKRTDVALRFSTVAGGRDPSELAVDPTDMPRNSTPPEQRQWT